MRLLRGRAADPEADRAATRAMLDAAADGEASVRAWTPHRQVAFGRRDARREGYAAARAAADERGFRPVERDTGGRAVAYDGGVVAVAHAVPLDDGGRDVASRYETATATIARALSSAGASVERGEPPRAFCPGDHSLRVPDGGKVVGVAQRVRGDAALVGACVVVRASSSLVGVLDAVYAELGVPFAPESVGSVAEAGGPSDVDAVIRTLEGAFAPTPEGVERVD